MHIVEIGCLGESSLHHLIPQADLVEIFEANPEHCQIIRQKYQYFQNVKVHQIALWHTPGLVELHLDGPSCYVDGIVSPSLVNDRTAGKTSKIMVPAATFDMYDDGTIDILEIDIEGAEWYILQHLVSRPSKITVEMQWKTYVNPHYYEIKRWMQEQGYEATGTNGADVEFVKQAALV